MATIPISEEVKIFNEVFREWIMKDLIETWPASLGLIGKVKNTLGDEWYEYTPTDRTATNVETDYLLNESLKLSCQMYPNLPKCKVRVKRGIQGFKISIEYDPSRFQ